jgi:hypothetical protein
VLAAAAATELPAAAVASTFAAAAGPGDVVFGETLREAVPADLAPLLADPDGARWLVLALLFGHDPGVRSRQREAVAGSLGAGAAEAVDRLLPGVAALPRLLRLPVASRAFPQLRRLPPASRRELRDLVDRLSRSDGQLDVFEFALARLLAGWLDEGPRSRDPHGRLGLQDLPDDLGLCFAVLAGSSAANDVLARRAYEAGLAPLLPRHRPAYDLPGDWAARLGPALDRLARLSPLAKELVVEAWVRTAAHDRRLQAGEAELLRCFAAALGCPLPTVLPLVQAAALPHQAGAAPAPPSRVARDTPSVP